MGQVQEVEIPQILAAVAEIQGGQEFAIPLTYVVCQKRHNTRLFPAQPSEGDRAGNVLPGTQSPAGAVPVDIVTADQQMPTQSCPCFCSHPP